MSTVALVKESGRASAMRKALALASSSVCIIAMPVRPIRVALSVPLSFTVVTFPMTVHQYP